MNDNIQWFAARTRHNCERKVKQRLEDIGIEHYIPFRTEVRQWSDRKKKVTVPLIPGLVFIKGVEKDLLKQVSENNLEISFIYDKAISKRLVIPEKQMKDFIFVTDFTGEHEGIRILDDKLKPGDKVRVVKGDFAGIEGELIRIQGHKRVVIRMPGLLALATTYVPREFLEVIG